MPEGREIILGSVIDEGENAIGLLGPALAAATDPWFRTGTAVNVASGVTIPWS